MKNLKTYEDFLFESELNEGDLNYQTDQFALVLVGGSIGSNRSFPIFVSGQMASIFQTGNDKEELVEKKKRMNKQLSPGEKKYYGMSYKVIELTSSKRKDVDYLIAQQNKSEHDTAVIDESINESHIDEMKVSSAGIKELLKKIYDDAKLMKALHFKNFKDVIEHILTSDEREIEELEAEIKELGFA